MHYSLQYSKYIYLNYFDRLFHWGKTQGEIAILADAEENKSAKKKDVAVANPFREASLKSVNYSFCNIFLESMHYREVFVEKSCLGSG